MKTIDLKKLLFPYPSEELTEDWEKRRRNDTIEKRVIELPFNSERIVYTQRITKVQVGLPEDLQDAIDYDVDIHGYRVDPEGLLRMFRSPKVRPVPWTIHDNREFKETMRAVDQEVRRHIVENYPNQHVNYTFAQHIERYWAPFWEGGPYFVPSIKK